jgi:hypothetical protein
LRILDRVNNTRVRNLTTEKKHPHKRQTLRNKKGTHNQKKGLKGHTRIAHGHYHRHECKHNHNHKEEKAENWQDNSMFLKRRARNPPELPRGKGE